MYRIHSEDEQVFNVLHPDGSVHQVQKAGAPKAVLEAMKHLPRVEARRLADGGPVSLAPPSLAQDDVLPPTPAPDAAPAPGFEVPSFLGPAWAQHFQDVQGRPPSEADFLPVVARGPQHADMPLPAGAVPNPPLSTGHEPGAAVADVPAEAAAPPGAAPPPSPPPALPPFPKLPGYPSGPIEQRIGAMEQSGREGADLQRQAQEQQARELTEIHTQQRTELADLKQRWDTEHAGAVREWDAAREDYSKARVDPNRFWNTRDTGQKVSAIVGMILGGMGSGITGQPNAALAVIDRAIDRDVEAQKIDVSKKGNLVSMLHEKIGNVDQAAAMAKMYLYADVANKVALAGARAGTVQAQATAKLLESELQSKALGPLAQITNAKYQAELQRYGMVWQQRMLQYSLGQGGGGGAGYIPSSATPPMLTEPSLKGIGERNKDANERRVDLPQFGSNAHTFAKTPEQAKEVRTSFGHLSNLEHQVRLMDALGQQSSGVGRYAPGTASHGRYQSIANSLITELNKLQGLNRLNENEYASFGAMIPGPVELGTPAGQAKLKGLLENINAKRMEEYTTHLGLDPRLFQPIPEKRFASR